MSSPELPPDDVEMTHTSSNAASTRRSTRVATSGEAIETTEIDNSAGQRRRSRSSTPANGETGVSCRSRPTDDKTATTTSSKNGASNAALTTTTTLNTDVHYEESFLPSVTSSNKSDVISTPSKSDVLIVQQVQQQKCKFCGQGVLRTDFQEHILGSHRTEIRELIRSKKVPENECPECSIKLTTANDDQDLVTHFVASHYVLKNCRDDSDDSDAESDVSDKAAPALLTTNGPKKTHRRLGRKGDHEKPRNFVEFCRQVEQNLRTENGKFATAVDERSVRCVCGKVVRTCGKFYWKYLIQRPTVKNGQIIQKGHWFTCPVVIEFKSVIPPWVVTEQELEASRIEATSSERRNGVDANACDVEKRRAARKRVRPDRDVDQPTAKRHREGENGLSDDASDDSDDGSDDEVDPEIGENQAKYRVKKWVSERLFQRVPGEVFIQDGPCFQVVLDNVLMCHTCKFTSSTARLTTILKGSFNENDDDGDISCSFFAFRKLRSTKSGHVTVAGYLDPNRDPRVGGPKDDVDLWTSRPDRAPHEDIEKTKYILGLIGDQFCDMVRQERKCLALHRDQQPEIRGVAWKRAVRSVREMCDACKTTLFNYHWTCTRCGIFICLDCYQDEYNWPYCTNGETHNISRLLMAQIIPKDLLVDMATKLHNVRLKWRINQFCHSPDDLAKAFSDETVQTFAPSSKLNLERASKLFSCQFCPGLVFKWQTELYKHWVFKHFNDELKSELPDNPPFSCPRCDYVASNKTILLLHYGITHKAVVRHADKATPIDVAVVGTRTSDGCFNGGPLVKSRSISTTFVPSSAFRCPLCSLTLSHESRADHLSKHFYDSLSADLPLTSPFLCPKCRYVGVDRLCLLRHFGSFHGMCDKYLKDHLSTKGEDVSHIVVRDRGSEVTPKKESGNGSVECRLCERDELPALKNSSDLYRHLSETHFSERILKDIVDVSFDVKPYKCNKPACDFTSPARSGLVIHVGLHHRCAVKYYCEALGVSDDEEVELIRQHQQRQGSALQQGGQPTPISSSKLSPISAPHHFSPKQDMSLVQVCPVCSQRFGMDAFLLHAAEVHFSEQLTSAQLPTSIPFQCPRCPHCSPDKLSLLRHWLIFHKMVDSYAAVCLGRPVQYSTVKDEPAQIKEESLDTSGDWDDGDSNPQPQPQKSQPRFQCLMCDDVKMVGATPLDFHKHLVEKHFRERMLALIPCVGTSPEGKPKYACPFSGCYYEHHYKWIIAKHYGVKHKMAKQFYDQVTGALNIEDQKESPALDLKPLHPVVPEVLPLHSQQPRTVSQQFNQIPASQLQESQPVVQLQQQQQFKQVSCSKIQPMHVLQQQVLALPQQSQVATHNQNFSVPQTKKPGFVQVTHLHQQSQQKQANQFQPQVQQPTMQIQQQIQFHQAAPATNMKEQLVSPAQKAPVSTEDSKQLSAPAKVAADQPPVASSEPVHHEVKEEALKDLEDEEGDEDEDDYDLDDTIGLSMSESELAGNLNFGANSSLDESFSSSHEPTATLACKICAVTSKGMSEYLRHLSKVHFKQKLLSLAPKEAPFKCPAEGCDVTKKDRLNIALHHGIAHKVVLNLLQETPEDELHEDVEANCKVCHQSFTAHRYLYTHLSDTHFASELEADLPKSGPWKCPKCSYVGNDPRALRVHYGVRHKIVLNHLAARLGMNEADLKKEMKAIRKKAVIALKATVSCKFCPSQFKDSFELSKHLVHHLKNALFRALPEVEPFKCSECSFVAPDSAGLLCHFGTDHSSRVIQLSQQPAETLDIDMTFLDQKVLAAPGSDSSARRGGPPGNQAHQNRRPLVPQPSQRQQEEDKKFPKCQVCDYRYYSRLDLCRHFVDFHLRPRLANVLNPSSKKCPACDETYDNPQVRLRHFIWAHQNLEQLVIQDFHIKLSEFVPSSKDLEIVKQKDRKDDLSDLASLPVTDVIDMKLTMPSCELCGEEFKTSVNKARDKSVHLLGHFRESVTKVLPKKKPYKCPKCTFIGRDLSDLSRHYGHSHRAIFMLMQKELGERWKLDENETNDCQVCGQVFANSRMLNDHYCAQHFYQKLAEGLPTTSPFKCPQCNFVSKTQLALVRHVGAKHNLIKKLLQEEGFPRIDDSDGKSRTSSSSQDGLTFSPDDSQAESQSDEPQSVVGQSVDQQPEEQIFQPSVKQEVPQPAAAVSLQPPQQEQIKLLQVQQQIQQLPVPVPQNVPPTVAPYEQQWQQQPQQPQPAEQRPQPQQYGAYQVTSPFQQPQYPQMQQQVSQQTSQEVYQPEHHSNFATQPQQTYQNFQQQQVLLQHPAQPQQQQLLQQQQLIMLQQQQQQQQQIVQRHLHSQELAIKDEPLQLQQPLYKAGSNHSVNKTDPMPIACPVCNSTFLNSNHFIRHAADKHFMDRLRSELPPFAPFRCPIQMCSFEAKDLKLLVRHYGINHKMVIKLLNERAGNHECYDESILRTFETQESTRESCPLCSSNFGGRYMLLRHLADCHFRERLCQGAQQGEVYKCPECQHSSKDKGGFVRHYGLVHKMVQKWLKEMGIPGFDDESKKTGGGIHRQPAQQTPVREMDKVEQQTFEGFQDAYEQPQNFYDGQTNVSFAPPSTPSSNASFTDSTMYTTSLSQPGNQFYSQTVAPTSAPPSVAVQFDHVQNSAVQQFSPAMHRPASQPPPRPYSSSSNPLTSPNPHQQQPSPQSLTRDGGYPSPQTPGYGTPSSAGYESYYSQDFNQGQQQVYFNQPNGPMGRSLQQQRFQQPQQPAQTVTPQPMTPQPLTPGSHGTLTPQPMTPQDSGMMSPAPYVVPQKIQNANSYYAVSQQQQQQQQLQLQQHQIQQQIVQVRPQHGGLVQHQQQQQMFSPQPQTSAAQPVSRPVTLQPQDSPSVPSPSPEPPTTPAQSKSNSRTHTYVPPGDDYIEAPAPGMSGPYAIQCNFCRSVAKNKSDFYRHLSERHFKAELARELPQQPPYVCPLEPCTYSGKDTLTALVKHYGIVHKGVQKYLNGQIAGRYIHHDKSAASLQQQQQQQQQPIQMLPSQQHHPDMMNGMDTLHQQTPQQFQIPDHQPQQVMSNQALKVKCPFCELMFAARYAFFQHLCDKHFKDALAQQVPLHPPYQCPVSGCVYIARDSRQSLIRHYGMTHKVIVELLKRHVPNYEAIDPFPSDDHHLQQTQAVHQMQVENQIDPMQQQQHEQQQQQVYYHHSAQTQEQLQHQFAQQDLQDHMMQGYYQQDYQQQEQLQLQVVQQQHQQLPHIVYGQQHQQVSGNEMRFEPQIDGTFDPGHYSDHSLDGIRSVPTTPIKAGIVQPAMPTQPATAVDGDSIMMSMTAAQETEILSTTSAQIDAPAVADLDQLQKVKEEDRLAAPSTPLPSTPSTPAAKGGPKVCEICGKQFEGKNRAMLKVQHMANHFKDKLFADLKDKSAPFKCPIEGCSYQTKHKPDWARHYGSVHQFIAKYLKEYLDNMDGQEQNLGQVDSSDQQQVKQEPSLVQQQHQASEISLKVTASTSAALTVASAGKAEVPEVTDGKRTYSAFLPKADLHQIMTTALNQQSQPDKNFGVVTINTNQTQCLEPDLGDLNFVEQVIGNSATATTTATASSFNSQQCFMCLEWYKDEKELAEHMAQHIELSQQDQELKGPSKLEVLSPEDLEASLLVKADDSLNFHLDGDLDDLPIHPADIDQHILQPAAQINSATVPSVPNRSTGRPCEICGFEPKTKNKSRERQDHLAMKHYRERIQADLAATQNYKCPLCEYVGKDKQTIYRHYTGKHKVVEQYLADDLAAGRVIPLAQVQQQQQQQQQQPLQRAGIPSLPTAVEALPILQNFDLVAGGGLDLTVHSLVDTRVSLAEFMDQDHLGSSHERIMQVDGADDLDDEGDFDPDASGDDSSNLSFPGTLCPICDEPTKMHKTYHLASRHFKQRLIDTLPVIVTETGRVFKCPECSQDFKCRINLWTHYLGKHRFGEKWTAELLAQSSKTSSASPAPTAKLVTAFPPLQAASVEVVKQEDVEMSVPPVVVKSEPKSEVFDEKIKTPRKNFARSPLDSGKRADFWCDLCQSVISNVARVSHFASVHFEPRLRTFLPTAGAFCCPLCRHEGKNFSTLSTHFLGKHVEFMKKWLREDLDKLEEAAFAKMANSDATKTGFKHDLSSGEEIESSEEDDVVKTNPGLVRALQRLGQSNPDLLRPKKVRVRRVPKRRKTSRDICESVLGPRSDVFETESRMFRVLMPTNRDPIPVRTMTIAESGHEHPRVPHSWLCNGKLLVLEDPKNKNNLALFQKQWIRGQPVIVSNVTKHLSKDLWSPESFSREFGHVRHDIVNTRSNKIIPNVPLKMFWDGFEKLSKRMTDDMGNPMLMKLKDWPPDNDFSNYLPTRFEDLMNHIPLPDYTRRDGRLNLASSLPDFFMRPDLGPKMYIAYGNALYPNTGTTNLHIDMSDACNVMVYVSIPKDGNREEHINEGLKSVEESDCDVLTRERMRDRDAVPGAIWHIYHPRDADKIRDLLNKVALERGRKLEPNTDPIHDQNYYLDSKLRQRLYKEYGVVGYAYPQCVGDTVFIPAGAPHQVRNVHNCIKVAEDFVSPENLEWCFYQTEEFRHLSEGHTNHEDKLQIKSILYHAVKDALAVLEKYEETHDGQTC